MKTTEEEGIGVHSLTRGTMEVKGPCWNSEMRTRTNHKWVNYSYGPAQTKQQVS
jgi:hypothetical protein